MEINYVSGIYWTATKGFTFNEQEAREHIIKPRQRRLAYCEANNSERLLSIDEENAIILNCVESLFCQVQDSVDNSVEPNVESEPLACIDDDVSSSSNMESLLNYKLFTNHDKIIDRFARIDYSLLGGFHTSFGSKDTYRSACIYTSNPQLLCELRKLYNFETLNCCDNNI